ncbi:bifunctional enoyl-CoA hydratase/phosphate acetyltransferase [Legionella sp. km772]|uniref:bifunctional enoyl-CoA hydratase/phosphate acetyltransferase n=1 Tax=Legionella sp. km772 TaxID=2498111 RepID=UPI000F8F44E1|nr:bifunctional enoyl-CoA hydratase/phosphate acetyltransferase [Legionella sp. km772]RUR13741.1 bifunctional enoyl-CoA hydratase/phosphate acetyltransferase [Legionella sp. km772]
MDTILENVTFDELTIGQKAELVRTLTKDDIILFAAMSGDINPAHLDPDFAKNDLFHEVVGHGMWSGALISNLLGTVLPGPGTIYVEQDIKFKSPMHLGDTLKLSITVREKINNSHKVYFDCLGINQKGQTVIEGNACVIAPLQKLKVPRSELPRVSIDHKDHFNKVIKECKQYPPIRTAIVHPTSANVLEAAFDAQQEGLIIPILIGPADKIHKAAQEAQIGIEHWDLIDTEHSDAAAQKAVELAAAGKIEAIMKGSLHTDELMSAIVCSNSGLRTKYRISHVYIMDVPTYHKPLFITDAAINIAPNVEIKADICQNAINLWHVLYGDELPKVAILAAVEVVNPKMQATVDAAVLCKMLDRGQITNAILDGPLAFDNAINKEAARTKNINSPVAGDADILLVPEIEAGNMLAKQLSFLTNADAAGIVCGARVPIILPSRADSLRTRLLSCAVAVKMADARKTGKLK